MASLLDLKNKITSTKNTGQITKALEMVSAARQRKAQDFLNNSRFLREGVRELMVNIGKTVQQNQAQGGVTRDLPRFFQQQTTGKVLIVAVMSQRGLCGALNANLFFEILKLKKSLGKEVEFVTVNKLSQKYLRSFKANIQAFFAEIPENPDIDAVMPVIDYVKDRYNEYETVYIAYSNFIKSGLFKPRIVKLLPIENLHTTTEQDADTTSPNEYSIEPDPITVLDTLSSLYIDLEMYEAVLSSQASEHSARMIAMKKATDNVKSLVNDLTLKLNKERQAKITQQMAEISSNL